MKRFENFDFDDEEFEETDKEVIKLEVSFLNYFKGKTLENAKAAIIRGIHVSMDTARICDHRKIDIDFL